MTWQLTGEYLENCNCDVLCPCITSSLQGPADHDRCVVPLAMHITAGQYDGVSLDGLGVVMVVDAPQVMGDGGWRVALYVDERADDAQRQALGQILSGAQGGPPAMLAGLIGEQLGVKFVPITFESSDDTKRVTVPGIMDFQVTGLPRPGRPGHAHRQRVPPDGRRPGRSPAARWGPTDDPDYGWSFDNTGKNGHYRDFAWQG